jgi:hypothetical protein
MSSAYNSQHSYTSRDIFLQSNLNKAILFAFCLLFESEARVQRTRDNREIYAVNRPLEADPKGKEKKRGEVRSLKLARKSKR